MSMPIARNAWRVYSPSRCQTSPYGSTSAFSRARTPQAPHLERLDRVELRLVRVAALERQCTRGRVGNEAEDDAVEIGLPRLPVLVVARKLDMRAAHP